MDPSRGGDSRYNLNYSMSSIGLSLADQADLYGNPAAVLGASGVGRSLMQQQHSGGNNIGGGGGGGAGLSSSGQCQNLVGSSSSSGGGGGNNNNSGGQQQQQSSRGIKRTNSDCYEDHHRQQMSSSLQGLDNCTGGGGVGGQQQQNNGQQDVIDETANYTALQTSKKSPPANGKKTKGRVKIKMEYIDNKLRRYTTFSKRKTGIMKKAYELSTLTGTQVMLLVASETGHVYTFATRKLQPMITSEAGKQLIQTCLNSPDPPSTSGSGDQRMSATGFEETELSYNIADEDSKDDRSPCSSGNESDDSSDIDSPGPPSVNNNNNSSTVVTESPIIVTSNSSQQQQQQQQQQQHSSQTNTNANSNSVQYDVMKLAGMNNVLYPSTLANIPQEVLLSLVQAGHLQLHTEDDGSGHQFITIPLSMTTSSSGNNSISGTSNTRVSSSQQQLNINNKIHVKDFAGKATPTPAATITTSSIGSGNSSTSSLTMNGRESPTTLRIKKEIE